MSTFFATNPATGAKLEPAYPEATAADVDRAMRAAADAFAAYRRKALEQIATFLDRIAQEILSLGVEIKDFEQGLCDFPHWRDGRVVYLCWQRGEDRIEWWHDTDAGFAGRQPL